VKDRPHRAFEIDIHIGADTWGDAAREVERVMRHIIGCGQQCGLASGGYSTGASVMIVHRPEMTHDRYFEQLDAHLAAKKANDESNGGAA